MLARTPHSTEHLVDVLTVVTNRTSATRSKDGRPIWMDPHGDFVESLVRCRGWNASFYFGDHSSSTILGVLKMDARYFLAPIEALTAKV